MKNKYQAGVPRIHYQRHQVNKVYSHLYPVADPENFGGGGFEAKTSKIRLSSPKLRLIFRPKSEIQTFFSPKIRWSPKKKKKVFTKIETDFSAGFVTFRSVGGMHPEMEPNYSK